jgi:hypothetical protein
MDPDGNLHELITLNGTSEGISEEDLDRFVAKFPIEPLVLPTPTPTHFS